MKAFLCDPICALYLLVLAAPFGAAGQNILLGLWLLFIAISLAFKKWPKSFEFFWLKPLIASFGLLACLLFATWLNDDDQIQPFVDGFGYLFWVIGPFICGFFLPSFSLLKLSAIKKFAASVVFIWSLIGLGQFFFPWKIEGISIVATSQRIHGLYSHPLSLAYSALLLWPIGLHWWWRERHLIWSNLFLFSVGVLILFSQSRTVQVVCLLALIISILRFTKGRAKIFLIFALCLFGSGLWFTDNMISRKFKETISISGLDRFSEYPDDRMVFWHAHTLMFLEKPFLGHGFGTSLAYRRPYFEKIGFADFEKIYPAHNTYLQLLVNGGILGCSFFLLWWFFILRFTRTKQLISTFLKPMAIDVFLCFSLASLTQNAFQDTVVRTTLTVLVALLAVAANSYRHESDRQK